MKDSYGLRGELRVFFNTKSWDTKTDGLIYTDKQWVSELRAQLINKGFSVAAAIDIDYSEQGMQGRDYVSLDAGAAFINDLDEFTRFVNGQKPLGVKVIVDEVIFDEDY